MAYNPTKDEHRQLMLGFLQRDIAEARQKPHIILGFKVWARTDAMWEYEQCPRAAQVAGVYLPDEVPDLYPEDCPSDDACCCTLRETVLSCEDTPEARLLREKIAARGMPTPPPPWEPMAPLTAERQAETLAMIETELQVASAKHVPMWKFLRDLFRKKSV